MSLGHKTIPDPVTLDGSHYETMIVQRNGVPAWSGRWMLMVRPTPIAWGIAWHWNRINLCALPVLKPTIELPKQLR